MDTTVIVSLITSFASILIAVTTLLFNHKKAKEFETFKLKLSEKKARYEILDEHLKSRYKALGELIGKIQVFKDYLLVCQSTLVDSLDSDTALKALTDYSEDLTDCYQRVKSNLTEEEDAPAHRAKKASYLTILEFKEVFKDREYLNLSSDERGNLESKRLLLTEMQNSLRDLRLTLLGDT